VRIDSGFAWVRLVMTRRARALQRTNARGAATWVSPETDGGAVGDPLDHAALSGSKIPVATREQPPTGRWPVRPDSRSFGVRGSF
jgi:hypothetical protein